MKAKKSPVSPSAKLSRKTLTGPSELLGTNGVAELLSVHPKHVYRLLRRGLPAHRLGGEWRFDANEVLAWVRARPAASSVEASAASELPPLLAANGDICVELLLERVREATGRAIGLVQADRTTGRTLVESGQVVAAGVHGASESEAESDWVQIQVTRRELGLVFPKRQKIRSLKDVPGLRLAGRAPSAGIRAHLDRALREHHLDPDDAQRGALLCASHRDVVLAVLSGKADVGVASLAWAERGGLGCLPFAVEDYSLCMRASDLAREPARSLVRTLQTADFRSRLASVAGYNPHDTGRLRI